MHMLRQGSHWVQVSDTVKTVLSIRYFPQDTQNKLWIDEFMYFISMQNRFRLKKKQHVMIACFCLLPTCVFLTYCLLGILLWIYLHRHKSTLHLNTQGRAGYRNIDGNIKTNEGWKEQNQTGKRNITRELAVGSIISYCLYLLITIHCFCHL